MIVFDEESIIGRRIIELGVRLRVLEGAHVYLGAPLLHEGRVRVPRTGLVVQDDYGVRRQIKLPCQVVAQHHDISHLGTQRCGRGWGYSAYEQMGMRCALAMVYARGYCDPCAIGDGRLLGFDIP